MATKTITRPNAFRFTGKTSATRSSAYLQIAPAAFAEDLSRSNALQVTRTALGAKPSEDVVRACRTEYMIGRVAARLPVSELPKGCKPDDSAGRLEFSRDMVCRMAAPPKPGTKSRALRLGQIGRRTPMQQRAFRTAEEAASVFFAELNLSNAKTLAQRNNAKKARGAQHNVGGKAGGVPPAGKGAVPSHAELVVPKPLNAVDAVQHVATQMASLLAFCNKHAKLVTPAVATAVRTCQSTVLAEANAIKLRADAVK
jgi:hypothetical protein